MTGKPPERRQKKSETIDVRAPYGLKKALMERARREGRPASEIVRELIEDYLKRPLQRPATQSLEAVMTNVRKHPRPAFAAILGAAGVSALLASAIPAGAAPDFRELFDRYDTDKDGIVTRAELGRALEPQRAEAARRIEAGDIPPEVLERLENPRGSERMNAILQLCFQADTAGGTPPGRTNFMAAFDNDADGQISAAEYEDRLGYAVNCVATALDRNRDGQLDSAEYQAVYGSGDGSAGPLDDGESRRDAAEFGEAVAVGYSFGLAFAESASAAPH